MIFVKFFLIIQVLFIILLKEISPTNCQKARLLTSYLPASMQALAYYIDQLQYEPSLTVPVETPFNAPLSTINNISQEQQTTKPPNNNGIWQVPTWWQETKIPTITQGVTTQRPIITNLWQPPSWWQNQSEMPNSTITTSTEVPPTPSHSPGIFSPHKQMLLQLRVRGKFKNRTPEGYEIFSQFETSDTETLAILPLSLINDIRSETEHDDFTNDVASLDNFLRLYDDNYGRETHSDAVLDRWSSTSTAGKKRVPPNKPYVEFLLIYDLLKRDAKAENLSKYEGYSDEILEQLHSLSSISASRQLYELFQRMLERGDIQRSDVVSRIQSLSKELGNPQTDTSKALQYIPPLKFLP